MHRLFVKLIGKGELDAYYRGCYRKVKEALEEWHGSGKNQLVHGSAAAILVGSKPGASCPAEDALLATQNILLAAHSMGLGSCLIGMPLQQWRKILRSSGLSEFREERKFMQLSPSDIPTKSSGVRPGARK